MPRILTTNAVITCPHGGVGTTIPATPIASVQGGVVTAEGDAGTLACPFIVPCAGYTLRSMGLNASTLVGRRVILATDFQQSITGLPLTIVETGAAVDDSTPAPLPAGAAAAPLAPELLDVAPPVVTATPPMVPFTTSLMQPATAAIAFTLAAPFPKQWMLTLLDTVVGRSVDATNGLPGGLVVAPAGGAWPSPGLTVTVTMSAAFMASLGVGTHWLYLTGVTQRGISAFAAATVVVSA